MPDIRVNGVRLAYEERGAGRSLIWVHGGWGDRHDADLVAPALAEGYRVIAYDRRGHSESERPAEQQNVVMAHVGDLAGLIQKLDAGPAHLVTNSFGGELALKVALRQPELVASLSMHEPNLFGILGPECAPMLGELQGQVGMVMGELTQGNHETAARLFMDTLIAPGTWASLPDAMQRTFAYNAPTVITDFSDPTIGSLDVEQLTRLTVPTLLTLGGRSGPLAAAVQKRLSELIPHARRHTYPDAGHFPQVTHPRELIEAVSKFLDSVPTPVA